MPENSVLTVRLPDRDIKRLDRLARSAVKHDPSWSSKLCRPCWKATRTSAGAGLTGFGSGCGQRSGRKMTFSITFPSLMNTVHFRSWHNTTFA